MSREEERPSVAVAVARAHVAGSCSIALVLDVAAVTDSRPDMVAAKPKPPEPPTLKKVPLTANVDGDNDAPLGSLVAEAWSSPIASIDGHRGFALTGSSRVFLVGDDVLDPFW